MQRRGSKRSVWLLLNLTHRSLSPHVGTQQRGLATVTTSMSTKAGDEPGLADIAAGGAAAPTASCGALGPVAGMNRALEANAALPNSRYVQLATVRADGRPAVRTVVFRGFLEGAGIPHAGALQFTTDTRSEKCEQLAANNAAEAAWFFPETQVRRSLAQAGHVNSRH